MPPDENGGLRDNKGGGTRRYRDFRERVRNYYRRNYPLTDAAKNNPKLNPGGGEVSPLCFEPRVGLAALNEMLAPHRTTGIVRELMNHKPVAADVQGDGVRAITLRDIRENREITISADYIIDATELGDLLPLTKTEHVTGAESKQQTNEPHAPDTPQPQNIQSFTWCLRGRVRSNRWARITRSISRPQYDRWRDYTPHLTPPWTGKLLSWTYCLPHPVKPSTRVLFRDEAAKGQGNFWEYRKIIRNDIYTAEKPHEATMVNWPMNDYWEHGVIDRPAEDVAIFLEESRQLSLSLMYWMQTEAPRPDGKQGYRGLYLRPDLLGTKDGLAMARIIANRGGSRRCSPSRKTRSARKREKICPKGPSRGRPLFPIPSASAPIGSIYIQPAAGKITSIFHRCRFRFRWAL